MNKYTITITVTDDDENEVEHILPSKNEVCPRCQGYGSHTDPSIDGNGITSSEWSEWDRDDQDSYMNGEYDVSCEECHGNKVVQVPDATTCSKEQLKVLDDWYEQQEADARYDANSRHEREMGY